ncbi:hypothetical protein SAICODRAFT_18630 [Saitoella complicata NRRL Y-17804]|uniref:CFEM domain-containing protein n=1 Tax=Saitoella complicata (strain BCRC 22490 / CBS 7301 / JCM 7358 / NBRC 10748 / NRRL Y-17804) TaxID=698492 RepID=A0A0E9NFX1_SAICN|nr:uncharacterized protein SAICODRAFT_18630 [Saitoella complicata NRRL Y-17804]ODQ53589.1 hypothetical protein SAICODRAFT_18630 [Saitoella complicata NRRL Y-17804]GAO48767.1 hypothetical protein G7K_2936-t1 [Saitoella complicata NRRL Y-17804]
MFPKLTFALLLTPLLTHAQSIPGLPACAGSCYASAQASSGCSSVDIACICSNTAFIESLVGCVLSGCDAADQATVFQFAQTFCGAAGVSVNPSGIASAYSATAAGTGGGTTSSLSEGVVTSSVPSVSTVSANASAAVPTYCEGLVSVYEYFANLSFACNTTSNSTNATSANATGTSTALPSSLFTDVPINLNITANVTNSTASLTSGSFCTDIPSILADVYLALGACASPSTFPNGTDGATNYLSEFWSEWCEVQNATVSEGEPLGYSFVCVSTSAGLTITAGVPVDSTVVATSTSM